MSNVKISALTQGSPLETDIIPFVDLTTNTTKKALKSELKGDKGNAATVNAGTTTTLTAGQSATVTNIGTTSDAIFNFAIPQGIQGLTGANGACVESVSFVGNDMVFVLDDASTVTLTNAKTDLKGNTGAKIVSGAFVGDDLVFTLDDNSTATVTGAKTDLQGIQGIQGIQGVAGNGISNISLISTVGLVKTYRITYTDDTTFDYTVTDGANGTGTLSSVVAGTNISIDNTDVNNPVINNTQDISGKENVSNKENTTLDTSTTKYPTNRLTKEYADGKVEDNIVDGHTTIAPSGNAVFDALALKADTTAIPVKASGAEIDTGTDDAKFATAKAIADSKLSYTDGTETLTNKRITPRVISATSYTTDTGTSLNADNCDVFRVTAQAGDLLFNAPGGTPTDGQKLIISVASSTTTARALTWNAIFEASTVALPTTTAATTAQLNIGFIYSLPRTKWVCVASC